MKSLLSETAAAHIKAVEGMQGEIETLQRENQELKYKLHEHAALVEHQRATIDDLSKRHAFWQAHGLKIITSLNNVQSIVSDCVATAREAGHSAAEKHDARTLQELAQSLTPEPATEPPEAGTGTK